MCLGPAFVRSEDQRSQGAHRQQLGQKGVTGKPSVKDLRPYSALFSPPFCFSLMTSSFLYPANCLTLSRARLFSSICPKTASSHLHLLKTNLCPSSAPTTKKRAMLLFWLHPQLEVLVWALGGLKQYKPTDSWEFRICAPRLHSVWPAEPDRVQPMSECTWPLKEKYLTFWQQPLSPNPQLVMEDDCLSLSWRFVSAGGFCLLKGSF